MRPGDLNPLFDNDPNPPLASSGSEPDRQHSLKIRVVIFAQVPLQHLAIDVFLIRGRHVFARYSSTGVKIVVAITPMLHVDRDHIHR